MLSIFTASTGPSALTGLPVNGSSSGPLGRVGVGLGVGRGVTLGRGESVTAAAGRAGAGSLAGLRATVTDTAVTAARPRAVAAVRRGCRDTACRSRPVVPRGPFIGPPSVVPLPGLPSPRNGKRETGRSQPLQQNP